MHAVPPPGRRPRLQAHHAAARPASGNPAIKPIIAWMIAGAIFLSISRFHQHVPLLAKVQLPMLLNVGGLLGLLSCMDRWRPGDLQRHWIARTIGLISVIAVLGIPFGIFPGQSFSFFNEVYSRTLLTAYMVWAVARSVDGSRLIAKTIALAGITAAVLAVQAGRTDQEGRLSGAYTYDANDLALLCVLTIPLICWWGLDRTNRFRLPVVASIPLLLYVLVATDSRGGFLGIASVITGFLVLGLQRATHPPLRRAALGITVAAVLAVPFLPGDYIARISSIFGEQDYNTTSATGRKEIWKRGMGYAFGHPVFGVGMGNFNTAEGTISVLAKDRVPGEGLKWSTAHNSFVLAYAELGLIAGTLFVALVVRTIFALLRQVRRRPKQSGGEAPCQMTPMVGLCFVGLAVGGFFLSFTYYDIVYILFALACALLMRQGAPQATGGSLPPRRAPARRSVLVARGGAAS